MAPRLLIKHPGKSEEYTFELGLEETRIGRLYLDNDLLLSDKNVSRQHAVLRRVGNQYLLIDLNSINGTFVNGKRIREQLLADQDTISIGGYTLVYDDPEGIPVIQYNDQRLGSTVLLRTPDQVVSTTSELKTPSPSNSVESLQAEVETLKKRADALTHLYELSRILSSVFSLQDIFKKVSEILFRLTPANRFVVLLSDSGNGELSPFVTESRDEYSTDQKKEISISKTVVNRVISERVSLLSVDAQADARLAHTITLKSQRVNSVMCAPLLGKESVFGVIYVDCQDPLKMFSVDDLDLLNALAVETSMAVDNATTHEQLLKEALARAAYGRFMPQHVVDEILANPHALSLGGTNQVVTILFCDIRGFTAISESLRPETIVQVLNEYFAEITPIVFEHQGVLDKYIGDGLMALFGVPYPSDDAAAKAVAAAIAMQRRVINLNEELKVRGLPDLAIGIGINTGTVTVGYIGSDQRTDYTAIGDTVNVAARLEQTAVANQIRISQQTLAAVGDLFPVRLLGRVPVKGRAEPVEVFEVLWETALCREGSVGAHS
ncbi:MAG: FHA domain-containing protein [Acidobacteria bacterium]|nr:FHA domain-containing protein [Acidobacteriota bacterium]